VAIGPELLTLMEQVRGYQAKNVEFPEAIQDDIALLREQVDEAAILRHLYASLPLIDLMSWLKEHYGHFQDITLVRLYHKLTRLPDVNANPQEQETRIALKQIAIRLHSHSLASL
jgi:hypothetical protein